MYYMSNIHLGKLRQLKTNIGTQGGLHYGIIS